MIPWDYSQWKGRRRRHTERDLSSKRGVRARCHHLRTTFLHLQILLLSQSCSLPVDIKFLYNRSDCKTSTIRRQNSPFSTDFVGRSGRHWNSVSSLSSENRLHHSCSLDITFLHTLALTFQRFLGFLFPPPSTFEQQFYGDFLLEVFNYPFTSRVVQTLLQLTHSQSAPALFVKTCLLLCIVPTCTGMWQPALSAT
jgi:hypothetical protein